MKGRPVLVALFALAFVSLVFGLAVGGGNDDRGSTRAKADRTADGEEREEQEEEEQEEEAPPRPPIAPWSPPRGEVYPRGKRVAARVAQALTTYEPGESARAIATRAAGARKRSDLARAAAPLFREGSASRGRVIYVQLGGVTPTTMSAMVVVRQSVGPPDENPASVTRTLDIRLARSGGPWRLDQLASAGGSPVRRPSNLSRPAAAVVDNPRIDLPDSARWDIYRGNVDPRLLTTMAAAAERAPFSVAVIDSGHPRQVFATARPSAHSVGYAVDIWAVRGRPVVSQRRSQQGGAYRFARSLFAGGVKQLGSPWTFVGAGSSFTDQVHQDHLHLQKSPAPVAGSPAAG